MYSILSHFKPVFSKKVLCKAPFVNIYISGDGSVTPCCFNRINIFGNIYETPLNEILNNSTVNIIRESIIKGIFPSGCEICKNLVKNGNKANSGISTYENLPISKGKLSIIEFELSYKCNLHCIMCKLNEDKLFVNPEKTKNKKFDLIKQITPFISNVKLMRFYGGEPFFIEEYYSIWQKVIEINSKCKFIVQTNGTILNQRVKDITAKGIFNFNMSLDSLKKTTYESIRIGANFDNTISNLFKFREISDNNNQMMIISVCPIRTNWKEMPQILEFCNKNKFYIFFNTVVNPWHLSLWSLSTDEIFEIINYYSEYNFKSNSINSFINNKKWKSFLNLISYWYRLSKQRPKLSGSELLIAKNQLIKLLKFKLEETSEIELIQKIENILPVIINYIPISSLIEKIKKTDSNILYNEFLKKESEEILENLIQVNHYE